MRLLPLALAAVLCLALAAPAGARIVPQKGMIGIKLQQTSRTVIAVKGPPDSSRTINHPVMGKVAEMKYGRTTVLFDGTGLDAKVVSLTTRAKTERTARGIGVGSRKAAVRARVAGVKCENEFGVNHCYLGRFEAGRRVTDFFLGKNGRVTRVTVGFVID